MNGEERLTERRQVGWQPSIYDMVMDTRCGVWERWSTQQQRSNQGCMYSIFCPNGEVQLKIWKLWISLIYGNFTRVYVGLLFLEGMGILKFLCTGSCNMHFFFIAVGQCYIYTHRHTPAQDSPSFKRCENSTYNKKIKVMNITLYWIRV